jgi:hypothetical protein
MNTIETVRLTTRWLRWLRFPLVQILLAGLFLGIGVAVAQGFSALLSHLFSAQNPFAGLLATLVALLVLAGAYAAYVYWIERRALTELALPKAGWELGSGVLIGLGLFSSVIFGAAYLLTGRLWLAVGMHIAWDVANDGIFGVGMSSLSGTAIPGILRATLTGPAFLSGGANRVEGSLVTFLVIGGVCLLLLMRVRRQRQ